MATENSGVIFIRTRPGEDEHFFAFGDIRKAIGNAGAGKSRGFNDVAEALMQVHG